MGTTIAGFAWLFNQHGHACGNPSFDGLRSGWNSMSACRRGFERKSSTSKYLVGVFACSLHARGSSPRHRLHSSSVPLRRCWPSIATAPRWWIASLFRAALRSLRWAVESRPTSCARCCRQCAPTSCWRRALREVWKDFAHALAGSLPAELTPSTVKPKSMGDVSIDVVYVPVNPCRLVETRGTFPAVYQGRRYAFAPNADSKLYAGRWQRRVPHAVAGGARSRARCSCRSTASRPRRASGDIEILPQGGTFGSTATLIYLGSIPFTSASAGE